MEYYRARSCEQLFLEGGPFFHLHTSPIEQDLLFNTPEEMDEALNFIALAAFETTCRILSYAIMHNHLHFIVEGGRDICEAFFERFKRRLALTLSKRKKSALVHQIQIGITPINSLKQLRDEIVYVIRNPFVDRVNVHVFAYKWCSGFLYFNDFLEEIASGSISASKMSIDKRRAFKHERNADIDPRLLIIDGTVLPSCFVDYKRVEAFFENARQFVQWVLKNVESQIEIAKRLGEQVVLDDSELWSITRRLSREIGGVNTPRELPLNPRTKLIKTIKYDYGASNAQIARCTGLPRNTIDDMFPLSARKQ